MANQKTKNEDEYNRFVKILDFRLPNYFKKIGLLGAIFILLFLVGYKFLGNTNMSLLVKDVLRTLILLFLLLASLSKDKLEDEFNRYVRFQSYIIAFVCTTVYSIFIPLIALIFDVAITNITNDGTINFYEISSFEVMFILMGQQLLFFETLKRFGRAE